MDYLTNPLYSAPIPPHFSALLLKASYGELWKDIGIKSIRLEILTTILKLPSTPRNPEGYDESFRKKVETAAVEFVKRYEEKEGREIEDRQDTMKFDFYTYPKNERGVQEGMRRG